MKIEYSFCRWKRNKNERAKIYKFKTLREAKLFARKAVKSGCEKGDIMKWEIGYQITVLNKGLCYLKKGERT